MFKGLSMVAMAVALAACGGGGGGDEAPAVGGGNNNGGGNSNATVVSYSAYLPNAMGQGFDRLVDIETRDGKASVVIDGVEQNYTLNTSNNGCTVSGGTGDYKIESCNTRSRSDFVLLCPTANDAPIAFLQRKDAVALKPSTYAELQQVANTRAQAGGIALNMAFCIDSLITTSNRIVVQPNGTLTLEADGESGDLNAITTGQLFSSGGYTDDDVKAGMKVFKWLPEVPAGSLQTVRYIVMFTGEPLTNDPELPVFPPIMFVTPTTLQLPAR
ncbi:hypothetical protein WAE61_18140 [Comamonadaceae bacterium PP-2]